MQSTERSGQGGPCARRYLYKLRERTNFPITPVLAAELDSLTLEQIEQQVRPRRMSRPSQGEQQEQNVEAAAALRVVAGAQQQDVAAAAAPRLVAGAQGQPGHPASRCAVGHHVTSHL